RSWDPELLDRRAGRASARPAPPPGVPSVRLVPACPARAGVSGRSACPVARRAWPPGVPGRPACLAARSLGVAGRPACVPAWPAVRRAWLLGFAW
ncbi:hypothetical protein K1W54_41905, partial [Micromonospora sp. CPCC 205371]|nr:hypothetical protein [Micromonospora sp. CPCC 205371]